MVEVGNIMPSANRNIAGSASVFQRKLKARPDPELGITLGHIFFTEADRRNVERNSNNLKIFVWKLNLDRKFWIADHFRQAIIALTGRDGNTITKEDLQPYVSADYWNDIKDLDSKDLFIQDVPYDELVHMRKELFKAAKRYVDTTYFEPLKGKIDAARRALTILGQEIPNPKNVLGGGLKNLRDRIKGALGVASADGERIFLKQAYDLINEEVATFENSNGTPQEAQKAYDRIMGRLAGLITPIEIDLRKFDGASLAINDKNLPKVKLWLEKAKTW